MPAMPERSDAADRCSPRGRGNRRMGQLMSDAISYDSAGRGVPVAQVCAEVCPAPISAAPSGVCIAPRCRFLRPPASQHQPCMLLPSQFLTIADTFSASSPIL
jgi:hypothetical protein